MSDLWRRREDYRALRGSITAHMKRLATTIASDAYVLDIGVGPHGSVLRPFLPDSVNFKTLDNDGRVAADYHLDICGAIPKSVWARFDLVVACEVLEHVLDPFAAMRWMAMAVARGGRVVVTVPFMFGVHEPADYWRFTPLGLQHLAQLCRLKVLDLRREPVPWSGLASEPLGIYMEALRPERR